MVEKPKMISYIAPEATNSWTVTRETETAPWILSDAKSGETLDTNYIHSISRMMNYYAFMDVFPPAKSFERVKTVKVETFDHFRYSINIGGKTSEEMYYITVNVGAELPKDSPDETTRKLQEKLKQEQFCAQWVYLVSSGIVEPLVHNRADLIVRAPDASAALKPGAQ
jgi:hypothetical protein